MAVSTSANLTTSQKVLTQALTALYDEGTWAEKADRQYDKEWGTARVGDTVHARRPVYYKAKEGPSLVEADFQSPEDGKVAIKLDQHKTVPVEFDIHDKTLQMPNFYQNYMQPMGMELGNEINMSIADRYWEVPNIVGTPGTGISDTGDIGAIRNFMVKRAIPLQNVCGMIDPDASESLAKQIETRENVEGSTSAMRQAAIGRIRGFDLYETPVQAVHTVGNYGGTPLVNGGSQTVAYSDNDDVDSSRKVSETDRQQLATDGWTNSVTGLLKRGDVITIDGVFDIHPRTKKTVPGELKNFTVIEEANSNGSGESVLVISPAIITSGAYQNVSGGPADDAALTVKTGAANSTHINQLFFPKAALTMAMVPLETSEGLRNLTPTTISDPKTGLALSMFQSGSILSLKSQNRVDALWGIKWVYPQFAVRRTQ